MYRLLEAENDENDEAGDIYDPSVVHPHATRGGEQGAAEFLGRSNTRMPSVMQALVSPGSAHAFDRGLEGAQVLPEY